MKKLFKNAVAAGSAIGLSRLSSNLVGSMNPMLALIFLVGQKLGRFTGIIVGIVATLVSSVYCGFGPWCLMQLILWSTVGFIGGCIKEKHNSALFIALFSFSFGVIMDIYSFFVTPMGYSNVFSQIAGGLVFDARYALVSTGVLVGFYAVEYMFNKIKNSVKSKLAYQAN